MDVIAVGTGKALKFGENGDVDVVLVHAREAEQQFMDSGHGARREDVMFNHFEILGPPSDPARIRGLGAVEALAKIAAGRHDFISRGDDSGTHRRERSLWDQAGGLPEWSEYVEAGQGMGATLVMANQMRAYTLADRGTYLAFNDRIDLQPLAASGENLLNPYGVLAVNPAKHSGINHDLADRFIDFLISAEAQTLIRDFRIAGEPLFQPRHLSEVE